MKGLLYRDIIINRKAWWCAVVLCLLSLKMLFDGSVNIEDDGTFVINLLVFLNIVVVYSFFDYVFSSGAENEARWKRFLCASPVTNKIIMLERYVVDYIFTLVGIISSSVLVLIMKKTHGDVMNYGQGLGAVYAITLVFLYAAVNKFFTHAFSKKVADWISTLIFVVIIGVGLILLIVKGLDEVIAIVGNLTTVFEFLASTEKMIIVMFVSIILHWCSYWFSVKIFTYKGNRL